MSMARLNPQASTGEDLVDAAIAELVQRVESLLPTAELGYYLHGSWASKAAHQHSDVDILALSRKRITDVARQETKRIATDLAESSGVALDFHLHPYESLIADPYVDLLRTGRHVYGVDYRPLFPEPSLDALAREAVLHACAYSTHIRRQEKVQLPLEHPSTSDEFFGRLPKRKPVRHAKTLSWLSSAYLAGRHEYAPVSAADALSALEARCDPFAEWVEDAVSFCRQNRIEFLENSDLLKLRSICERTLDFEAEVLKSVKLAVEESRLGPRCSSLLNEHLI